MVWQDHVSEFYFAKEIEIFCIDEGSCSKTALIYLQDQHE
jgi:hypothetical protein